MGKVQKTGTVFDFGELDGSWFTFFTSRVKDDGNIEYDDPEEGAGRICIRPINEFIEKYFEDRKKKSEFVLNPKTRAMERVEYSADMTPDERKKYHSALWDHAITAWENFLDGKGNEIKCTAENKAKMMKVPMFDRFVSRCLKVMSDNTVKQATELNENL
jgi:hypothetical protein